MVLMDGKQAIIKYQYVNTTASLMDAGNTKLETDYFMLCT
jgi:hypothetical protein